MKKEDELLNHDYDGIKEYDNDLPRWWVVLFFITIVWAFVYPFYFHGMLDTVDNRLAADLEHVKMASSSVPSVSISDGEFLQLVKASGNQEKGKVIFEQKCVACHNAQGQGLIGPNLTDDFWIHGAKLSDIERVISEGVLEKGMLAWKSVMSTDEIRQVVAYIWAIRGSNPSNPKVAEGNPDKLPE